MYIEIPFNFSTNINQIFVFHVNVYAHLFWGKLKTQHEFLNVQCPANTETLHFSNENSQMIYWVVRNRPSVRTNNNHLSPHRFSVERWHKILSYARVQWGPIYENGKSIGKLFRRLTKHSKLNSWKRRFFFCSEIKAHDGRPPHCIRNELLNEWKWMNSRHWKIEAHGDCNQARRLKRPIFIDNIFHPALWAINIFIKSFACAPSTSHSSEIK